MRQSPTVYAQLAITLSCVGVRRSITTTLGLIAGLTMMYDNYAAEKSATNIVRRMGDAVIASTRFRCSYEAERLWSRLRFVYALVREDGDAQRNGIDYAKRAMGLAPYQIGGDLGTEARMLHWDCQSRLQLLEARGPRQQAGVALARCSLLGQKLARVRERYGLDYVTAEELREKVKEWINWACDDSDSEEPVLDW